MNKIMTPQKEQKKQKASEQQEKKKQVDFSGYIIEQVINKMGGKPKNLHSIRPRNIFNNKWRIDVFCEHEAETEMITMKGIRIDYSYFVTLDEDGEIVKSSPEIEVIVSA